MSKGRYESSANLRSLFRVVGAVASILPFAGGAFATDMAGHFTVAAVSSAATEQPPRSAKTSETATALRDLWVGHIFWVRNVALATFDKNDGATKAAEERVVANARSLAAAIEPFYGPAAKDAFFKLLAGHYGAVKAYLVATVAGDASGQERATQSLTSNAEEIATFLSGANPHLPKASLHSLLLAHGGHHIQQIQELASARYGSEARIWESMKNHVYQIADATADALAKQFAKKFQ